MSDFSEKIKNRKKTDSIALDSASRRVYNSLGGIGEKYSVEGSSEAFALELIKISDFFEIPQPEFPKNESDFEALIQLFMSKTGITRRKITLKGKWWKEAAVPLITCDMEGKPYALLPGQRGYIFYEKGKAVRVTAENAEKFEKECYCLYKPMEQRSLSLRDFIGFMCGGFGKTDVIWLICVSMGAGLIGLIMPEINYFIFNSVIPSGTTDELFGIAVLIVGTVIVQALCGLARKSWVLRIGNKTEILAQNALWSRILNLPTDFFRDYSSGELSNRAYAMDDICEILSGELIPTLLTFIFSFVYIFQISSIAPTMVLPSLVIISLTLGVNVGTAVLRLRYTAYNNSVKGELSGLVFQLLEGITKIKLSGAEVRAFNKWSEVYSRLKIMMSKPLLISRAVGSAIGFGGTIYLYYRAYKSGLSASDYIAFNTALVLFAGAVSSLSEVTSQLAALKPAFDMLKPILKAVPENSSGRKQVSHLSGDIKLNKVRFRYNKDMPFVIDGLDLHIEKGEYLGIVGSSGCGKSTLVRLLLGFEKPHSGSIYYDMQDIEGLDIRSVRQRIGTVLQNGKLFSGDIYSNIVVCAPWLDLDAAWEAAEISGLAEDIENMPMGMYTMLSENGGGLSGGQKQRLLIARAVAPKPDILIFDEATSALDNITQAQVVKSLDELGCTRIVIAHRLSTIKNCSRIIYLDKGKIAEEGTYEELMELNGLFAETARRQTV